MRHDAACGNMRPVHALSRLFKGPPGAREDFQVVARGRAPEPLTRDELEDATEAALDVLLERAQGLALGPAASCNFERNEIELVFTTEASSAEDLHKRIGQVMRLLEEHGPFCVDDTSTSRLGADREPVPA
jgi:hypothetical protein